jgi:hypothetical protein
VALNTLAAAAAGATTVTLAPASAAAVVPGRTGFNNLTFGGSPDILITSVGADGVATLSRPLRAALAAGMHGGTTLRYAPFFPPKLADGRPNPLFDETLAGWLSYVATVCKEAASVVGPDGYDLEIWNELSFASEFLNAENYYVPSEGTVKGEHRQQIISALLKETVAFVRNPAHGISPAVGITNGFASQTPFPSGASAPAGLTALSKHPSPGSKRYPDEYEGHGASPVNALGERDGFAASGHPAFVPEFEALFPENVLTAIHTETVVRDVAPMTTLVYGFPHGRNVGPTGGPPVEKWITEFSMAGQGPGQTPADRSHFRAKYILRSLFANLNKGVAREYVDGLGGGLSLVSEAFMQAVDNSPGTYPGDALGGPVTDALRAALARFQGPGPGGALRQLQLLSIAQNGNHAQFTGDGTAAHPDLYDREVLAVLPFQSSPTRFVIPVYVMTRDLLTLYNGGAPATDVTRFDLPDETFRITLAGLPQTSAPPSVSAYDPLHAQATAARLVWRRGTRAVFELAATDYPRILTLEYAHR